MTKLCVLGLGYIGLPTAAIFATNGFEVLGADINPHLVDTVNRGRLPIEEPGLKTVVNAAVNSGNLRASTEPAEADVFLIAVPTPLTEDKKADLSYVISAAESIVPFLRRGNLVILESTSPPGTTRDRLTPILERSGLKAGAGLLVAHSPERVLPGRIIKELIQNDRVIGGVDRESAEAAKALYQKVCEGQIYTTDATTAEMVKVMENTYRDVNIALANELAKICESIGISAWEVIRLANRHPRVNLHWPGPGVGGHCLAVDPWFVVEKTPDIAQIIALSRRTNDGMPEHVAARVASLLPDVPEPKVAVLGVSYKGNIDDARESPALGILAGLRRRGIDFAIYDPHVRDFEHDLSGLTEAFSGADCVILVADHEEFKFLHPQQIGRRMRTRILLDTRHFLDHRLWREHGFEAHVLGERPCPSNF